jgi:hypothetical protein
MAVLGLILVNPTKGVENLPKKTGSRRIYLFADDVHRLAEELAVAEGFEPSDGVSRHTLSRRAP